MTSQSGGGGVPSGAAGGVLSGTYPSPGFATNGTTPILGSVSAYRTTTSGALTLSTWNDLITLALTAGTWDIKAAALVNNASGANNQAVLDLYDGTVEVGSSFGIVGNTVSLTFVTIALYVAAGPVTMHLRCNPGASGFTALATAGLTGSANTATGLYAFRIA